ncbi:MAG: ferritin family protein [Candidatus Gracilibacteria bacterium]|jgi:desulfoferrodoxin-like iron-binding protein
MKTGKIYQGFRCRVCGNEVEVQKVGGGELMCCGKPMILTTPKLTDVYLAKAFAGESQARNKYDYFAKQAKKDGLEQIAGFFEETALNEKEHAKREFKLMNGLGTTIENLKHAAEGEKYEYTTMYPEFAAQARKEGEDDVALIFMNIAKAEIAHEKRYLKLIDMIKSKKVFKAEKKTEWKCRNCGYVHTGATSPLKCPACDHPQAYFERKTENY